MLRFNINLKFKPQKILYIRVRESIKDMSNSFFTNLLTSMGNSIAQSGNTLSPFNMGGSPYGNFNNNFTNSIFSAMGQGGMNQYYNMGQYYPNAVYTNTNTNKWGFWGNALLAFQNVFSMFKG